MRQEVPYCNGKRAYDKRGAITAANRRFEEDHIRLRIYQCDMGDHWHLTKQLRRAKYQKRQRGRRYSR